MHLILRKIFSKIRNHIDQVSWPVVFFAVLLHLVVTWSLLWLAGEKALTSFNQYIYYYIVTTSTVGYGDFSPVTDMGKWLVAMVQIPIGLALFGVFLGKTGQTITGLIKQSMTGDKDFTHQCGHIIIFGWHETRTAKIIQHILADSKRIERRILLAVTEQMTHPFSDNPEVDFIKMLSFTDLAELKRVAVDQADKIIIDGRDDDQTFTTALRISNMVKPDCHISAYFIDETKIDMLREHCKNVECSSSKSAEILVRSMQDPGSSRVQEELLSTLYGDTQFSIQVSELAGNIEFYNIFNYFKCHHDAIVLGVAQNRVGELLELNPPLDYPINPGDILHYIAPERVLASEVDWKKLSQ